MIKFLKITTYKLLTTYVFFMHKTTLNICLTPCWLLVKVLESK